MTTPAPGPAPDPAPDPTGKRAKVRASRVLLAAAVAAALAIGVLKSPSSTPTPTPAPAPAPAPSPTPSPTPSPVVSLAKDDFTGYSSTAALQANITSNAGGTGSPATALYHDGTNASLVSLDPTTLYNGHATMKYSMPGGTNATPWLAIGFAQPLAHIWYRVKVRFSPGWTDTGTLTNTANAYKMLSWGYAGANGSGRLEITNTNEYDFYWNVQSLTDGSLIGGGNHAVPGTITNEWTSGGWYDYIIEVDHSASTSGVARIWMAPDGQVPVLKGTVPGAMLSGGALPLINSVSVGLNFNQVRAATQTQAIWWGQWEVVDGSQHANPFGLGG